MSFATRALVALLVAVLASCATAVRAAAANPIVVENSKPGDSTWKQFLSADNDSFVPAIDGYAGANSVRPGGSIDFHVGVTVTGRYRVEIVRLGWYGGSGGRRVACLTGSTLDPTCTADQPGRFAPSTPKPNRHTGEVAADWRVTDRLHVPSHWVSGYYLALFQGTAGDLKGEIAFAPFIVQAPVGDRAQILVVVPTNTWQAYNDWGGESLYPSPRAVKVSFDRPNHYEFLFRWEYPLLRFLERNGYDLSFATDDDVDRNPGILLAHRLDIAAGHGEYWTRRERNAWQAARAHGVNLAFMGANTGYWQVRYEDHDRTMVSYKYSPDPDPNPATKTVQFRQLHPRRPECELLGEQYRTDGTSSEDGRYFDYRLTAAGAVDPWFAHTALRAGSVIPGIVGFEFDSVKRSCRVPPVTVLLRFHRRPFTADAVRYRACSGSEVFDAGSLFFSWGLDPFRDPEYSPPSWPTPQMRVSPAIQQFMRNALGDMLLAHPRFDTTKAIRVVRRGGYVRIDPMVAHANLGVRQYAVGFSANGELRLKLMRSISRTRKLTWRLSLPRWAAAAMISLRVRTGDVRDSRQYVLPANGHGGVSAPARQLEGASCYGSSAHVLTAVFGGPRNRPLRVAVKIGSPFTITITHDGVRLDVVRYAAVVRRAAAARPTVVAIAPAGLPAGSYTIVVAGRATSFRLGALRAH